MNHGSVSPESGGKPSGLSTQCCSDAVGVAAFAGDKDAMTRSADRRIAWLNLVLGAFALAVAFGAQDFLGMAPCELCLWERWPYRIAILLGVVAFVVPPRLVRAVAALSALVFLGAVAAAFIHVGVEQAWWPSPLPECSASNILTGNLSSLMASLPAAPAKPCDAPNFLIPGLPISFATMDLIYAVLCLGLVGAYLARRRTL